MPKSPSEMNVAEIQVRLAEVKIEEERHLCEVQTLRIERAELELAALNLEQKGKK